MKKQTKDFLLTCFEMFVSATHLCVYILQKDYSFTPLTHTYYHWSIALLHPTISKYSSIITILIFNLNGWF